ncbi:MAG: four helix bundle protein [Nitrospinae bacterium]|nr:four helix bundle protein [Nitrospinota bacterium]
MVIKSFKDLQVWQKAYALALELYKWTARFPEAERYGLTAQIRRSAVSVPSNIAEGYARAQTGEYLRFLHISYGSLAELETKVMLARDLGYGDTDVHVGLMEKYREVERMLSRLMRAIKPKPTP